MTEGAQLTPRERQLLALVATGATNREIGRLLGITESTVKNMLSSRPGGTPGLYEKIGVGNRAEAVKWWFTHANGGAAA